MQTWRIAPGAVALVLLLWSAEASAGWVIEQVVAGAGGGRQQVVLQSNRMKTLVLGDDGRPGAAFMVDLNAGTITQVNYGDRSYVTATVSEYVETMRAMQQSAGQHMSEAMKQMESALKDMPPEQRKMMEEMMRSQMGRPPGGAAPDCREPRIEVRPTGQTATIAGFSAVRHDVLADGAAQSQLWVARGLTAWRELDPQKLQRFAAEMAKVACGAGARGVGDQAAWRAATEGYPVRIVDRSGTTVEVVKAESRAVAAGEFQPPPGFARRSLDEMMGR